MECLLRMSRNGWIEVKVYPIGPQWLNDFLCETLPVTH
jgi:hypothetical protein